MTALAAALSLLLAAPPAATSLEGAWKREADGVTTVLLFESGYFTSTAFTAEGLKQTWGGPATVKGDTLTVTLEFDSGKAPLEKRALPFVLKAGKLTLAKEPAAYTRVDDGKGPLAGVWRISGRMQDGALQPMHTTGTRKTLKLLTGTRFQWFAIDPGKGFFGATGAGTYSFEKGKYTERIEVFSKDASKVGAALTFDGALEGGKWRHSGFSSKGDRIDEVWERL